MEKLVGKCDVNNIAVNALHSVCHRRDDSLEFCSLLRVQTKKYKM